MIIAIRLILIISVSGVFFTRTITANASLDEQWLHDAPGYARALELQRKLKVPLIVYFYTDWCPYCYSLDTEYLPNSSMQEYLRGVVKVRINPEHGPAEREIADRYDVTGYPRFYVFRSPSSVPRNLKPFRPGVADLTPEQYAMVLQQFAPSSSSNIPAVNRMSPGAGNVTTLPRNTKRPTTGEVLGGFAVPLAIIPDASLPSLETVLERYVAAIGGREELSKLTTRVTKGRVDIAGYRGGRMESFMKAPNKSLTVIDFQPHIMSKQGFDGRSGWALSKSLGMQNLKGPELAALASDADFYRDLRMKEVYATTKLLGKTKSGFRELYVVQAVPRGGVGENFYFDVESGLLFRRDTIRRTSEGLVRAVIYYADWRDVDGIRLPFSITQSMPNLVLEFTVEDIKHNVPLDEAVFRRP